MIDYTISTDKSKLDIDLIYDYLANRSYWAKGRSLETVISSIDHSLCFGLYNKSNKQIGFGRVVTDYSVFAYIMDIFVLEDYRKQGLSKALVDEITRYPTIKNLQRIMLATSDAHGLYEKFGFKVIANPGNFMEIVNKPR